MRAVASPMTKSTLGQDIALASLTTQKTDSAQTKVRELEMSMLVNKQVIWLQITINAGESESQRIGFALVDHNLPMNDTSFMQVFQAQYDLRNIVLGPLLRQ